MKNKRLAGILFVLLILITVQLSAQVGINSDNSQPHPSAGLDIKFTDKGLLPPRMTHTQMNAIVNPANGLIIYCTDCSNSGTGAVAMYINNVWVMFAPSCILPLFPSPGNHIAAPTQIVWNWNPVTDATGYKWNTVNDYGSATDMLAVTTKTETGLACNTPYQRYVWSYNACGNSAATTLSGATVLDPPDAPAEGTHVPSPTQIEWNWNMVSGATGYKWNTTNDYSTATEMGTATTKTESGLTCSTPYTRYVWAYGACGNSTALTLNQTTSACPVTGACPGIPNVYYEGKTYNTVMIGTQCWFKESLNTGTRVDGGVEQTNNSTIEKHCMNNLESNCDIYGALYQWNEMMQYTTIEGSQGICPGGWHIPSDAEYATLITYLDGELVAGGKMKEAGTSHWSSPNTGATNSSGFTALPAGYYNYSNVSFYYLTYSNYLWSSTQSNLNDAWMRYLDTGDEDVNHQTFTKTNSLSVRCIAESCTSAPTQPSSGTHDPTQTQIIWNWNAVSGATGYKWNITNDYNAATDMGTATTKTETGLACITSYTRYVWAYNSCGSSEPLTMDQATTECSFACGQLLTDSRDSKTYTTVLIGTQCWMAQSLDIGSMISGAGEQADNGVIEKYCYGDLASNCETYGGLYQWGELIAYLNGASNTTSWNPVPTGNIQGICPAGWHIPSSEELLTLTDFLGGEATSGGKMKESGFTHWLSPNTGATNESGLTLLGSGARMINGMFTYFNTRTYLRASTESDEADAVIRRMIYDDVNALSAGAPKSYGLNVRCIKTE